MSEIDKLKKQLQDTKAKLKLQKQKANMLSNAVDDLLTEQRHKKNFNFIQLYKDQMKSMRYLAVNEPMALAVLLIITERMNKQNAVIISQKTLQDITGRSKATIARAIKVLKEQNWIRVKKVGTANAYLVNSKVFWRASAQSKWVVSLFDENIYSTKEEYQKSYIESWSGVEVKYMPLIFD